MSSMDEPEASTKALGSDSPHESATQSNVRSQDSASIGVNRPYQKHYILEAETFPGTLCQRQTNTYAPLLIFDSPFWVLS